MFYPILCDKSRGRHKSQIKFDLCRVVKTVATQLQTNCFHPYETILGDMHEVDNAIEKRVISPIKQHHDYSLLNMLLSFRFIFYYA